jgi:capsular polysaccharide biosynthesis protein
MKNTLIFGESGVLMMGNRKPAGYGLRFLGHDYCARSLLDIVDLTLEKTDEKLQMAPFNIVMITDPFSANYYHSLLDYAGRLSEVEALVRDHDYMIGIPPSHAPIMIPILEALGFGESVYPLDRVPTAFDTVAVVASPQVEQFCHPSAMHWLRDRVCRRVQPGPTVRLLVSRQDASVRRIINEAALALALERFGVRLVIPGTLTPAEQLALFASAELIVAPHGAGLANLIACQPGTKVVEIAAEFQPTMFFTSISNLFGFHHVLVQATKLDENLLVNIDDVLAAIADVGIGIDQPAMV